MKFDRDSFITGLCCVIISVILWIAIMDTAASADDGQTWNETGSLEVQDQMWTYLMDRLNNPIAAAAIMGNAGCESNYCPWRYCGDNDVEGDYNESRTYVDSCSKKQFVYAWLYTYPPGWGLFQFATNYHMENLWELAEEKGVPSYDVELQCSYMLDNLESKRPEVYEYLLTCTDLADATEVFRSFGVGSTFSEKSVLHRMRRAADAYEKFTGEEYAGEINLPLFNGGSLHYLKE